MAKHIQAYFKTENQAESSKTTLFTYKTEQLEVSKLENAIGKSNNVLFPLVATGNMNGDSVGMVGTPGAVTSGNVIPVIERNDVTDTKSDLAEDENPDRQGSLLDAGDVSTNDYNDLRYVLVAKVEDLDYNEIVQKLRQNGAYVEKLD
ncbi:hypothetical protein J2T13_000399 [Paenibacillus sp. DS2015]|uniref:hypothetical protein n=1 Tax=Paenibacillus sp. DS2015 TaxID=3373917 RepID=UPI003D1C2F6F